MHVGGGGTALLIPGTGSWTITLQTLRGVPFSPVFHEPTCNDPCVGDLEEREGMEVEWRSCDLAWAEGKRKGC